MSLFLRNLFFTLLQPGLVAGVFPYLLATDDFRSVLTGPLDLITLSGIVISVLGIVVTVHCIVRFATEGRGTLSPADPTTRLVVRGLYKYSRNPMYVGVMLILAGECIFTLNLAVLIYTIFIFTAFNLFIRYREEPRLMADFREDYARYRQQVRKWI
jgi:protein-S-isoprenylcysteine O-methyltransferase Ste14